MMTEDGLTTTAKRLEAVRRIITNTIWIAIVIVVLATIGRYLMLKDAGQATLSESRQKPIAESIPWNQVDQAVANALTDSRASAELFASQQLDAWVGNLMQRVDPGFLDWYFSYWTQQLLGLEGLWQYGVNYLFESQPTAAEKLTEKIQEEFSTRVLRPQIAELELERIVRETTNHYIVQLRRNLETVPASYKIPHADWDRYIEGIALTTHSVDGNRETPVTLKALTVSAAGGAVLLAGKMNLLIGKLSGKVMAKSAGKAASKIAAKTGGKVAAKAGGKFLGAIVGVGVLVWDVWDHNATKTENRPILRQAMADYFKELQDILLNDPEAGIMTTFTDLEHQVFMALRVPKREISE
ncbi:MAG: hypothetical protein C0631_06755 [Sedimenticola sp.]|nr:MAG: hypothetical protein C0631_06755 [Sedimenticola sp.]